MKCRDLYGREGRCSLLIALNGKLVLGSRISENPNHAKRLILGTFPDLQVQPEFCEIPTSFALFPATVSDSLLALLSRDDTTYGGNTPNRPEEAWQILLQGVFARLRCFEN